MDETDDERLREWLYEASTRSGPERQAYLEELEQRDPALAATVRELVPYADGDDAALIGRGVRVEQEARALPDRIGPYTVEGVLGHGGMGRVYLAHQSEPIERRVALKVIRPGLDTEGILRRFRNERRTLERLRHPGIARALDAGSDEVGRPWVAMELIDGPSIDAYTDLHGLDLTARLELFRQVCAAVTHAHRRGILHRDLKCGNLLVVEEDGKPRAVVVDFGMATLLEPDDTEDADTFEVSESTGPARPIGTLEYMAPEQVRGESLNQRADVYALGVVLFRLVTGRLPHTSAELRALGLEQLAEHLERASVPLASRLLRGTRSTGDHGRLRELDWVIQKAMAPEPARRYASVYDLREDIDRFLAGEVVRAVPPSRAYLARKFLRRHRVTLTAVAITAAVGLLVSSTTLLAYKRVAEARDRANASLAEVEAAADFLSEMIVNTSPHQLGPETSLRELLNSAGARFDSVLSTADLGRARLRPVFGRAFIGIDDLDTAALHFDRALEEVAQVFGSPSVELADVHLGRSHLRERQGDIERMIDEARTALAMLDELGDPAPSLMLRALAVEGYALARVDIPASVAALERAVAYARANALASTAAGIRASTWYADSLRWAGERERALEVLDAAETNLAESDGDWTWDVAARLHRARGALLLDLDEPERASAAFTRAHALYAERLGPGHRGTLALLADAGLAKAMSGDLAGAIDDYEELAVRYDALLGPAAPDTLVMRCNLLSMYLESGDHAYVLEHGPDLLETLRASGDPRSMHAAQVEGVMGIAHLELGDATRAEGLLGAAVDLLVERGAEATPLYDRFVEALVRAQEANGDEDDAERLRARRGG